MPNGNRDKERQAFDKFYSNYPEKRMERREDIYATVANMKDDQGDLRTEYDQFMRKMYGDPKDPDDHGKLRQMNNNTKRIKALEKLRVVIYTAGVCVLYIFYKVVPTLIGFFTAGGG